MVRLIGGLLTARLFLCFFANISKKLKVVGRAAGPFRTVEIYGFSHFFGSFNVYQNANGPLNGCV